MYTSASPLAKLVQLRDAFRELDDNELIAAWKANDAALPQPNRIDGDPQARFRHYAFRMAALERFGFAEHTARCHREPEADGPLLSA